MKLLYILLLISLYTTCHQSPGKKNKEIRNINNNQTNNSLISMDTIKLKNSKAVIQAEYLSEESGGKYSWTKVRILQVLENKTEYQFTDTLSIAYYSWKKGIPGQGIYIIYLTPFPFGSDTLNTQNQWMLLEGDGKTAVERL